MQWKGISEKDLEDPQFWALNNHLNVVSGLMKRNIARTVDNSILVCTALCKSSMGWKLFSETALVKLGQCTKCVSGDEASAEDANKLLASLQTLVKDQQKPACGETACEWQNSEEQRSSSCFFCFPRSRKEIRPEIKRTSESNPEKQVMPAIYGLCDGVKVSQHEDGALRFISADSKSYRGFYRWSQKEKQKADVYLGEFQQGKFHGYGELLCWDGAFYKGQWKHDEQSGSGVQRWPRGAVYCGTWDLSKEHGFGVHYQPSGSTGDGFTLFIGSFNRGFPIRGIQLEGRNFASLASLDLDALLAGGWQADCRCFRIEYDGRTAFWQLPTPLRKEGPLEMRVRTCDYFARTLTRGLLSQESLEQAVWFRWVPLARAPTGGPNILQAAQDDSSQPNFEIAQGNLFKGGVPQLVCKTVRFRGSCVRNRQGMFPCPTEGVLVHDLEEYKVEFDGQTLFVDNPTPVKITGRFGCATHVSARTLSTAKGKRTKESKEAIIANLKQLALLEAGMNEIEIEFRGGFLVQSFPTHGIMLLGSEVYKVEFDGTVSLQRVCRKQATPVSEDHVIVPLPKLGSMGMTIQDKDEDWVLDPVQDIDFDKMVQEMIESKRMVLIPVPEKAINNNKLEDAEQRKPAEAAQEALKFLSGELMSPTGSLHKRLKENPQESWQLATHHFEGTNNCVFYGWFRKVFCPAHGSGRVTSGPKQNQKNVLVENVFLNSCQFFPGSEEWLVYFLLKFKTAYMTGVEVKARNCLEQASSLEKEIQKFDLTLRHSEHHKLKLEKIQADKSESHKTHGPLFFLTSFQNTLFDCSIFDLDSTSFNNHADIDFELARIDHTFKSTWTRSEKLKEEFVKQNLIACLLQEHSTDLALSEAHNVLKLEESRVSDIARKMELSLKNLEAHWAANEENVSQKEAMFEQARIRYDRAVQSSQSTDTAEKRKMESKVELEVAKREPDLAALSALVVQNLVKVMERIVAIEDGYQNLRSALFTKSAVRLRSDLALTMSEARQAERRAGGTDARMLHRIAVLREEAASLRPQSDRSAANAARSLLGAARKLSRFLDCEASFAALWCEAARAECSNKPINAQVAARRPLRDEALRDLRRAVLGDAARDEDADQEIAATEAERLLVCALRTSDEGVSKCVRAFAAEVLEMLLEHRRELTTLDQRFPSVGSGPVRARLTDTLGFAGIGLLP